MTKKDKKGNKAIILTVVISVFVVAALVLTLVFADPLFAAVSMHNLKNGMSESSTVLISAPMHSQTLPVGAEKQLEGYEARELIDEIYSIVENVKYDSTQTSAAGFWDTKLIFFYGNESTALYLKEDSVYMGKGSKGYVFKISESDKDRYKSFFEKTENILAEDNER